MINLNAIVSATGISTVNMENVGIKRADVIDSARHLLLANLREIGLIDRYIVGLSINSAAYEEKDISIVEDLVRTMLVNYYSAVAFKDSGESDLFEYAKKQWIDWGLQLCMDLYRILTFNQRFLRLVLCKGDSESADEVRVEFSLQLQNPTNNGLVASLISAAEKFRIHPVRAVTELMGRVNMDYFINPPYMRDVRRCRTEFLSDLKGITHNLLRLAELYKGVTYHNTGDGYEVATYVDCCYYGTLLPIPPRELPFVLLGLESDQLKLNIKNVQVRNILRSLTIILAMGLGDLTQAYPATTDNQSTKVGIEYDSFVYNINPCISINELEP